jgi:DNA-binding response OmpR family regulator
MLGRILVVDDETDYSDLVAYHLRREGYEVQTAGCGIQALHWLQSNAPDLILLDVMLPGVDGFSICELVRGTDRLAHVPILLLTACSSDQARQIGMDSGANDYVVKTVGLQTLLALVKEHLGSLQEGHGRTERRSQVQPRLHHSTTFSAEKAAVR